jgi:hypothetical protein
LSFPDQNRFPVPGLFKYRAGARDTRLDGSPLPIRSRELGDCSLGEYVVLDIEPMGNDKTVTEVGKDTYQTGEQVRCG